MIKILKLRYLALKFSILGYNFLKTYVFIFISPAYGVLQRLKPIYSDYNLKSVKCWRRIRISADFGQNFEKI